MPYLIFKICIILLYCYFTMLCSNLSKCNFNVVMKLIRADTKYILLGRHYEVVLIQSANHRHSCSIQVSSNSIQHLHVPLELIMSHNQCPFKYFDKIYIKLWCTTISLKTNCVIIVIINVTKFLNIIINIIYLIHTFISVYQICIIPRYLVFTKYLVSFYYKNDIFSIKVYLYDKYIILIPGLSKSRTMFHIHYITLYIKNSMHLFVFNNILFYYYAIYAKFIICSMSQYFNGLSYGMTQLYGSCTSIPILRTSIFKYT